MSLRAASPSSSSGAVAPPGPDILAPSLGATDTFGFYLLAGGGWYYRYTTIGRRFFVPPLTICQPVYNWWELACRADGYLSAAPSDSHGSGAGGANGGVGFTIRFPHTGWKFFAESRYHYVWSTYIPTTFVPITFGFRYN
jgi:hypothetical protein